MSGNLTYRDFRDAVNRVKLAGRLLYAVLDAVPEGTVIFVRETEWNYAYVIFRDEETAQRIAAETGLELLHLRDAPMKPPAPPPLPERIALHKETEYPLELRWRARLRL